MNRTLSASPPTRGRPLTTLWARLKTKPTGLISLALFATLSLQPVSYLVVLDGRWTVLPFWVGLIGIGYVMRRRTVSVGLVIIAASIVLRLHSLGLGYGDQMTVSQAAWERVLDGGNPYGLGYAASTPPGQPFPYGPLALFWWLPGPVVEFAAVIGLMALLLWRRAWLTLAVIGGWYPVVSLTFTGVNDYSPALLIALGVVLLRSHPLWGGATLAVAAALKPYAAAWFLPAIGYGGASAAVAVIGLSILLWSPLLVVWGIPSFFKSVGLADQHAHMKPNALNVPALRWMAAPFAVLGLLARRWEHSLIFGSAVFIIVLYSARWTSDGYIVAVVPPLGMALESLWKSRSETTAPR